MAKKKKSKRWIQKATASIKRRGTKGKCTPITKPGCTGRAKALAKTFKKMAKKRKKQRKKKAEGGYVPEYGLGGLLKEFGETGFGSGLIGGLGPAAIGLGINLLGGAIGRGKERRVGREATRQQEEADRLAHEQSVSYQEGQESYNPFAPTFCRGGRAGSGTRGRRWKRGQKGWRRPYGGRVPEGMGTDIEIEKKEVTVNPDDYSMFQADLNDHGNATAENQMSFMPDTMIYSDREKIKAGKYKGKTFARAAAKVKRAAESPSTNETTERTTKRSLDNVFNMQENEKIMKAQKGGRVLKAQGGLYTPVSRDRMMSGYYQNMSNRNQRQGSGQNVLGTGQNWGDIIGGGLTAAASFAPAFYNWQQGKQDPYKTPQLYNPYEKKAINLLGEMPQFGQTLRDIEGVYAGAKRNIRQTTKSGASLAGGYLAAAAGETRAKGAEYERYHNMMMERKGQQAQMMAGLGSERLGSMWQTELANQRALAQQRQFQGQTWRDVGMGAQNLWSMRNKRKRDQERLEILRHLGYVPESLDEYYG